MKAKFFSGVALAVLFALVGGVFVTPVSAHHNQGHCPTAIEEFIKDETAPFAITAPIARIFTKAYVKAGSEASGAGCFAYTTNINDGCYSITGIGTATITATKVGDGSDCKDISHFDGVLGGIGEDPEDPEDPTDPEDPIDPETPRTGRVSGTNTLAETSTELSAAAVLLFAVSSVLAVRLKKNNAN